MSTVSVKGPAILNGELVYAPNPFLQAFTHCCWCPDSAPSTNGYFDGGICLSFIWLVGNTTGLRPNNPAMSFPLVPSNKIPPSTSPNGSSGSSSSGLLGFIPPSYQINSTGLTLPLAGNCK